MGLKLAYLGPRGTYSEQAAIDYDPSARHVAYASIPAVVRAADEGEVDEAVVPIENSLEGTVTFTVDLLIHQSALKIKARWSYRFTTACWLNPIPESKKSGSCTHTLRQSRSAVAT